jgi:hypothetical protein
MAQIGVMTEIDEGQWPAIRVEGISQVVDGRISGVSLIANNVVYGPDDFPVDLDFGTEVRINISFDNIGDVPAQFRARVQLIDPDGIVRIDDPTTRTLQPHTGAGSTFSPICILDKPTTPEIGTWYIHATLEVDI